MAREAHHLGSKHAGMGVQMVRALVHCVRSQAFATSYRFFVTTACRSPTFAVATFLHRCQRAGRSFFELGPRRLRDAPSDYAHRSRKRISPPFTPSTFAVKLPRATSTHSLQPCPSLAHYKSSRHRPCCWAANGKVPFLLRGVRSPSLLRQAPRSSVCRHRLSTTVY